MSGIQTSPSHRLPGYDYCQPGAYFITLVTYQRAPLFGEICDAEMHLSHAGMIVAQQWNALEQRFQGLRLDAFVVMPDHVHGILFFEETRQVGSLPFSLGTVVRSWKSACSRRIHYLNGFLHVPVWQENFFDAIIRGEKHLAAVRGYILGNPVRWEEQQVDW